MSSFAQFGPCLDTARGPSRGAFIHCMNLVVPVRWDHNRGGRLNFRFVWEAQLLYEAHLDARIRASLKRRRGGARETHQQGRQAADERVQRAVDPTPPPRHAQRQLAPSGTQPHRTVRGVLRTRRAARLVTTGAGTRKRGSDPATARRRMASAPGGGGRVQCSVKRADGRGAAHTRLQSRRPRGAAQAAARSEGDPSVLGAVHHPRPSPTLAQRLRAPAQGHAAHPPLGGPGQPPQTTSTRDGRRQRRATGHHRPPRPPGGATRAHELLVVWSNGDRSWEAATPFATDYPHFPVPVAYKG